MNVMTEFISRETIKEQIDEISNKFFNFKIVDDEVFKSVEDETLKMLEALSTEVAKRGTVEENWPMIVAYLMDTVVAQLIVVKLQNKFIKSVKNDGNNDKD